jgi:uncharacterized protein (DUF302 family)
MSDTATLEYALFEPFEQAVRSIRTAVTKHNLRIAAELDVSKRIAQRLALVLSPCRILFVSSSRTSPSAISPFSAVILPLHVVISSGHSQTTIHVQNRICPDSEVCDPALAPIIQTQSDLLQALDAVAMRSSLVV